jgi:nicotinamidase-related amidase
VKKALIIIDVQNGLMNKNLYKKEEFIQILDKAIIENKTENNEIIFIQHNSETLRTGSKEWEIYSEIFKEMDVNIIQKKHGDAFKNTELKHFLNEKGIIEITICGLVSHGCVFHTCINGIKKGFIVKLLKNGHTNWLKEAERKINEVNEELEKMGIELL